MMISTALMALTETFAKRISRAFESQGKVPFFGGKNET